MAIFTLIGAGATALGVAGVSTFLTSGTIAASLTKIAIGIAVSAAASAVTGALTKQGSKRPNQANEYQFVINQSTAARRRFYGRCIVGGVRAFWDVYDNVLYQVVVYHHGRVFEFEAFYFDGDTIFTDESNNVVTAPWNAYASLTPYLGDPDQTVAPVLQTYFGSSVWGSTTHRLRGVACAFASFSAPPEAEILQTFPNAERTEVRARIKGAIVYDPRTDSNGFSANAALCTLDYFTHPDGFGGLTIDDMHLPSWIAAADLCDGGVNLQIGGTELRYRIAGGYDMTEEPKSVSARMLAAFDGEVYLKTDDATGRPLVAVRGGQFEEPSVTIDASDILSHSLTSGVDALDKANVFRVLYTSLDNNFQETEARPWRNEDDIAINGERPEDFTVEMVPSPCQALRLAKIEDDRRNAEWRGSITTNARGMLALGDRTIRLVLPELSIDGTFEVAGYELLLDAGIVVGVEMKIVALSEDVYEPDAATGEAV